MYPNVVQLQHVLSFAELQHRWPGQDESLLLELVEKKILPAYLLLNRLKSPSGKTVCFCELDATPSAHAFGDEVHHNWDRIIFRLMDVTELESQYPYLKWAKETEATGESPLFPLDLEENEMFIEDSPKQEREEWIRCTALANRWGWSPLQVLDVLGDGLGQLRYATRYCDFIEMDALGSLNFRFIHFRDLNEWERQNAGIISLPGSLASSRPSSNDVNAPKETPTASTASSATAKPTIGIISRLQQAGETTRQIAARFPDFFGYDEDDWETVYNRFKAFKRGAYKGNRRR